MPSPSKSPVAAVPGVTDTSYNATLSPNGVMAVTPS